MGDTTFGLAGRGSPLAAMLLGAIGLVFAFLFAAVAVHPATPAAPFVAGGLAVASVAGFGAWARRDLQRSRGARRLTVSTDRLTIEHPDPLRAPLHLPRDLVRAIAIDASDDPHARLPVTRAFSWHAPSAAPDGVEGHLWVADDGDAFLPVLGGAKDKPTVAILLHHPAAFDAARAARARGADARTGRTTLDRERHVLGFTLAVADPAALAAALADWPELVETITTDHFRPEREPRPEPAAATSSPAHDDPLAAPAATPAPAEPTPAPPLSVAPPLPPAPTPALGDLDLPRPRSVEATRRVALALGLGFAVPFALLTLGLLALSAWMLLARHAAWFWVPAGLAAGMLYAVLHAEDRPEPGIALAPHDAPALHAFVAGLAAELDTPAPTAIRLTLPPHDAIAATGDGATLYLGLPALAVYDRDALRALVAHELAHHGRRHTGVGVIVHRTFTALDRLHDHLRGLERSSRFWGLPAAGLRALVGRYAALAAPVAVALKRDHEIEADHVAAATVGPDLAVAELERYYALESAFGGWLEDVLIPALESGHRPPLAAGFATYCERPEVRRRTEAEVDAQRRILTLRPGAAHPPLGVRLAIARSAPHPRPQAGSDARARDRRSALALLDHLDLREQELLARFAGADRVATLQPVQAAA